MRLHHRLLGAILIAALGITPLSAAPTTFGIRGLVPVLCTADFSNGTKVFNGAVAVGELSELCNVRGGHRILLRHPSGIIGAVAVIDGTIIPLSSGDQTVLVDSNGPSARTHHLELHWANGGSRWPANVTLRAEPKGAVYY